MTEFGRNKALFLLLQKLIQEGDQESVDLIETLVKDVPSLQKTFEIMTTKYDKEANAVVVNLPFISANKDC